MEGIASQHSSWEILRYARFLVLEDDPKSSVASTERNEQKWKYVSPGSKEGLKLYINRDQYVSPGSKEGLKLYINRDHLLVTNDDTILENYFLGDMQRTMRGFVRGDSLLFVIKVKNEARKFRVRFARGFHASAVKACDECAARLSYYFPVRPFEVVQRPGPSIPSTGNEVLEGEVSTQELSQVIGGGKKDVDLPISYGASTSDIEQDEFGKLLRLFLMESSFPSFVEAIEKHLERICKEDEE